MRHPWTVPLLAALALLWSAPALAQTHGHEPGGVLHVGNALPYPELHGVALEQRRRARALRRATLRAAVRLDTPAEAIARGYVARAAVSPLYRPGLWHFRKRGVRFWGRVLEPRRPQALIFWCPSVGACRLAAFVFRAPPGRPPTYGGLLGWHRHATHATWMTHVWLTGAIRTALAQCAPFRALQAQNPALAWEPYVPDVPRVDAPCPDSGAASAARRTAGG
jgi:hypothetical protein